MLLQTVNEQVGQGERERTFDVLSAELSGIALKRSPPADSKATLREKFKGWYCLLTTDNEQFLQQMEEALLWHSTTGSDKLLRDLVVDPSAAVPLLVLPQTGKPGIEITVNPGGPDANADP